MNEKKVNYTKHFIFAGLIFVLVPTFGFGQPLVNNLMRGLGKAAVKEAVIPGVAKQVIPAVTSDYLLKEGVLSTAAFDDVTVDYFRNSKPNSPSIVTFQPITYPLEKNIVIGDKHSVLVPPSLAEDAHFFNKSNLFLLSEKNFPNYAGIDEKNAYNNVKFQVKLADDITRFLRKEFYSSLRTELVGESFPYEKYLPSERIGMIAIGVQHGAAVEQDAVNWVRAIKRKYPTRHIYFATEYVWDSQSPHPSSYLPPLKILRDADQLKAQLLSEEDFYNYSFLQEVIEEGVPVVGIEPEMSLLAAVGEETGFDLTDELLYIRYQQFATSAAGMEFRNKKWVEHLHQIRQQDPEALIIVYGGAEHMSYSSVYSIPRQFEQDNCFTILQIESDGKKLISPLLASLEDRLYQQFVRRDASRVGPDTRYVLTFKEPSENGPIPPQLSMFKDAIGADVLVVFPSSEKGW